MKKIIFLIFISISAKSVLMATAFTSKANGNWTSGGQTTWNQAGIPTVGDTVTITNTITINSNITVGISPNTGGTPAITINAGGNIIHSTGTLTVKGDISQGNGFWMMEPGSQVVFLPPSGQQYKWNLSANSAISTVTCQGTATDHCLIKTDTSLGGLNSYMLTGGILLAQGLTFADYLDVVNMGTSTDPQWGLEFQAPFPSADASYTHVSFTGSNLLLGSYATFAGNLTFSSVTFTSSVGIVQFGVPTCINVNYQGHGSTNTVTWIASFCSFDLAYLNQGAGPKFHDSLFHDISTLGGNIFWTDDTAFTRNVVYSDNLTGSVLSVSGSGDLANNYVYSTDAGNPHFIGWQSTLTNSTIKNNVFETADQGAHGDVLFPDVTNTLTATGNIMVPNATTGGGPGYLLSEPGAHAGMKYTFEHNTQVAQGTGISNPLINLDESAFDSVAGMIDKCRANLVVSGTGALAPIIQDGLTVNVTNSVTLSAYNAIYQPKIGTCVYSTTTQTGVVGYDGISTTNLSPYPNSNAGLNDFQANPQFYDSTRNLGKWGQVTQGTDGTPAAAIAKIAADRTLISQRPNGLLYWVREGFRPTNPVYVGSSYPGDTSTVDANGNSWGGSPNAGAMAVQPVIHTATFHNASIHQ